MDLIKPQEASFKAPSGTVYTVRETNGDDDAILSNAGTALSGASLNRWLAGIVVAVNGVRKKLKEEDTKKFLSRDRQALLFFSRIQSLGPTLKFIYTCDAKGCDYKSPNELPFEEDLNNYFWDFEKEELKPGEEGYNPLRMGPYSFMVSEYVLGKTSRGKEYRFKYLSGGGEDALLGMELEDMNKNVELITRGVEIKDESDKWVLMQNFKNVPSIDMAEIRSAIKKYDEGWDPISDIKCPKCKTLRKINLLSVPDFFFPTVI